MIEEINKRRSIRKYSKVLVEDSKIDLIVRAAMQAPSARNQQPWAFYIEKDPRVLTKVSEKFTNITFAKDASFLIVFLTDKSNLKTEAMYSQDLASCVTLSLLAAESIGVGACWCGIYPRQERMDLVREVFNLHDVRYEPFAIVTYGYPQSEEDFKFVDRYSENKILKH